MKVRKAAFEQAIVDEVELAKKARDLLQQFSELPPNEKQLLQLSREHSADIAARVFYEALKASSHNDLINKIDSFSNHEVSKQKDNKSVKIIVVPGMFYDEHPETGASGTLIMEVARKFGFEVDIINIQSGGSVTANSAIIESYLKEQQHPNIWLITISKGASDLRHYLQNCKVNRSIKGWINVAGIPKGLPYIDHRLSNPLKRLMLRLLCVLLPIDYKALIELQTEHPYWSNNNWPEDIEMIHVVPIPHSAHLNEITRDKYHVTLTKGPNDGFVPLTDTLDLPGKIYPIWGWDHFLRTPHMSSYLYQMFNYLNSQNVSENKTRAINS